ncbi:MAG: DUF3443 family protein [Nitrospirae bacterium]|nr:DUF3443 family protein [Nitrospirota bacterium]
MKRGLTWGAVVWFAVSCGSGSNTNLPSFGPQGPNVLSVTAGGSGLCAGQGSVPDAPCVSIKICQPGTSICQMIPDILVDTGSIGLRIFKSKIPPSITLPYTYDSSGRNVAQCALFGDGSALWGPVQITDVILGGEPAVTVPIQVIDSTFFNSAIPNTQCGTSFVTLITSPGAQQNQLAANGILGLDFFPFDAGIYYSCSTGNNSCAAFNSGPVYSTIPSSPVWNPVFLLPTDSNGIALMFPQVADNGAPYLTGALVLGIGTETNNGVASGALRYPVDPNYGYLDTTYADYGTTSTNQYSAYIDSGTNGFMVPDSVIPHCIVNSVPNGFFCPTTTLSLTAINLASGNIPQLISFKMGNELNLFSTNNLVFNNLGIVSTPSFGFIWGFPFFLGRTVYFGYQGQSTPLGTGPFYAY